MLFMDTQKTIMSNNETKIKENLAIKENRVSLFYTIQSLLILLGFVILFVISIVLLVNQYNTAQMNESRSLRRQFQEKINYIDHLLSMVTQNVEGMRIVAEADLLQTRHIVSLNQPLEFQNLQGSPSKSIYTLDSVRLPLKKDMIGNLTGLGSLSARENDFYREIHMALTLNPQFRAISKSSENAAWIYYTSKNDFINIYPWVSSNDFSFSKELLSHEFFTLGTPAKNTNRGKFWTEVYVDEYGKGLMTTCAAPVYDSNNFLGTVAIDLTIDFLNAQVKKFRTNKGVMCLFNNEGHLIAHPTAITSQDKKIKKLDEALPDELKGLFGPKKLLQDKPTLQVGSFNVLIGHLNQAPWKVIYYEPIKPFAASLLSRIGTPQLFIVFILMILVAIFFIITERQFIQPSKKFVKYILNRSQKIDTGEIGSIPKVWKSWFVIVNTVFTENEKLTQEIIKQNTYLDHRVKQRTTELENEIEERKQAEKALRENQELLTNILESMGEAVRVYDQNYIYQLVNKKYEEMAGKSRRVVMGKTPWEIFPNLKDTIHEHSMRKAMAGEVITNIEIQIKDSGETEVWTRESFSPIKNVDGDIIGVVGVGSDITRQKRDEEELHRLRNYLSNIIDSMPSVLVGVDNKGIVTQWNHQAEQVTGISSEKAISQPLDKVFPVLTCEMDRIETAIRDHRVLRDFKVLREDKEKIRYENITIFPLLGSRVEGAVIRLDDVTDQIRMEEMVVQSEKMLSVGGLAAGMAHEINNPLAGMIQTAQLMAQRLKAGANIPANQKAAKSAGTTMEAIEQFMEARGIKKMIEAILLSGHRASEIVTNMLSFARKDDTAVSTHYLDRILDKTIELAATDYNLKKTYDFKRIEIIRKYDDNLPAVLCQSSKIQQVLLNILTNGAQAMQVAGTSNAGFIIRTYIDSVRNMGCIEIQDNGPGMDEETRKKIFDPFFTTKPEGVGTGLGLSVSYFIITENHKGEMTVESSPGAGAKFIIRLPL